MTLIEILVVLGLVAMLASMVAVVVVRVRHFSLQVECQENLRQIGQTVNQIAMNNGGAYPLLVVDTDENGNSIPPTPWWVSVFRQWEGAKDLLDTDPATPAIELPTQLPAQMKSFQCRMAGALDLRPAPTNADRLTILDRSISYGLNFDVKLNDGTAYVCVADTDALYPALQDPPSTTEDKDPDKYFITEVKTPSRFILLSEANTQDLDPANWTGGRIAASATDVGASNDLHPAPIVGRHGGRANVLYADMHVDTIEVNPGGPWKDDVNLNTPLWTLPND
jgi:prepilin-type processing-associated H-X9-DG protein